MHLVHINQIAGVPVHYARMPVAPYGTLGRPRYVRLDEAFLAELEVCLNDLWHLHPWGKPEALVSGGCYVEKAGRHGEGRAIDIDAIWWPDHDPLITLHAEKQVLHYLGVEAVLRKHFGTVLDFWFGHGHEDHFHVDDGQPQGWTGKPPTVHAETLFLQAALKYVHLCTNIDGSPLVIDGVLGKNTRFALEQVIGAMFHKASDVSTFWNEFLNRTARIAFKSLG